MFPLLRALFLAAVLSGAALPSAHGAGEVRVAFIEPEHYTDGRLRSCQGADALVLDTLEQHLQRIAARCLRDGDVLDIAVQDIDLAGRRRAGACSSQRVMREVTWPRIRLAWTLRRGGAGVEQAAEQVSDMNYLWNSRQASAESTPLPYERRMLTDWAGQRFCR